MRTDIKFALQYIVLTGFLFIIAACGGGSGESTVVNAVTTLNEVTTGPDPLYQYQWHLNNTGQANFSSTVGISTKDINVLLLLIFSPIIKKSQLSS